MKLNHLKSIIILAFLTLNGIVLKANSVLGGEVTYKHLGNSTYTVVYKIYRSCKGQPLQSPTFNVSCADGSNSKTLTAVRTSIKDISNICSTDTLPCNPQNTSVTSGVEEHIYEATVNFTQSPYNAIRNNCCQALFSMSTCCRLSSVSNMSSGNFFLEAMVDLCVAGNIGNTSTNYTNRPIISVCCNQPYSFNNGTVESAEGDSLTYEFYTPLKGINDPEIYNGDFSNSYPVTPYCPPIPNKLDCRALSNAKPPRGIHLEKETGDFIYTPTNCSEVAVLGFKISEYRIDSSGTMKLVAYTKREMTLITEICQNNNPPYIIGNNKFSICEGSKLCFTIKAKDEVYLPNQTIADTVELNWDSAISAASFRILDPSAREKEAEFCWQTQIGDSRKAPYTFTTSVKDNFCSPPGISSKSYLIKVQPKAKVNVVYSKGLKGALIFELFPGQIPNYNAMNYRYSLNIQDSANLGTGNYLYSGFTKMDTAIFSIAGTYYVQYAINNPPYNCPSTYYDTIQITSQHITDITELSANDFTIYPNPSNGEIQLFSSSIDINQTQVSLYSSDGKLISIKTPVNNTLNYSNLSTGMYILEIQYGNIRVYKKVLIRE